MRYSAIALGVIVSADLLRFQSKAFERTYERYLGYFMVGRRSRATLYIDIDLLCSLSVNRSEVRPHKGIVVRPLADLSCALQNASMAPSTTSSES